MYNGVYHTKGGEAVITKIRTNIFLTKAELEKLRTLSRKTGAPVAELVRRAIDQYLEGQELIWRNQAKGTKKKGILTFEDAKKSFLEMEKVRKERLKAKKKEVKRGLKSKTGRSKL